MEIRSDRVCLGNHAGLSVSHRDILMKPVHSLFFSSDLNWQNWGLWIPPNRCWFWFHVASQSVVGGIRVDPSSVPAAVLEENDTFTVLLMFVDSSDV